MGKFNFVRIRRYIKFGLEHLVEKKNGLDFTMRDLSAVSLSQGKYHGYAKTVEEHIHKIFQELDIKEGDGIIDIGCGKGTVLRCAADYPFGKICGIDIVPELIDKAKQNFEILGIGDRISCSYGDAVTYAHYDEYRFFYFFNPFSEEIFKVVLEQLLDSLIRKPREMVVIYHNPTCRHLIDETGIFKLQSVSYDKWKDYETIIWYTEMAATN